MFLLSACSHLLINNSLFPEYNSKIEPKMNVISSQRCSWPALHCLPSHWVSPNKTFIWKSGTWGWKQQYCAKFVLCLQQISPLGKFMEMHLILLCWTFIYGAISFLNQNKVCHLFWTDIKRCIHAFVSLILCSYTLTYLFTVTWCNQKDEVILKLLAALVSIRYMHTLTFEDKWQKASQR